MKPTIRVSELRLVELLAHIGGSAVSPGAGVAGAVALALAAACASKAVSITLKHNSDSPELLSALATFQSIEAAALDDGDRDARAFEAFVHERDPSSIDRLVCEGERFKDLVAVLTLAIEQVEPKIQANMVGDLIAAKALASAAQRIQQQNAAEALKSR
jgi:Formiminotransferase-cyclodeaminase